MSTRDERPGSLDDWRRRHVRPLIVVRVLLVPWILFITIFLCIKGYWWGLLLLPFVALDLWLLRNLLRDRDRAA